MAESYDDSELRLIFNTYDRNSTGFVGSVEFVELAKALNSKISDEGIRKAFHRIDRDRDGRINFEEFAAWWNER